MHDGRQLSVVERTPADWDALGRMWQAFEQSVPCSFFQSWDWVGCLAAERFTDPVVIEVHWADQRLALGLFNRRRRRLRPGQLWLNETGHAGWDSLFVEHNDMLVTMDEPSARDLCLARAATGRMLTLNGIGASMRASADALPSLCVAQQTRPAPYIDLAAIAAGGGAYLDRLSANTRYQLRRSARRYASIGPLRVIRAGSAPERHAFLDALSALHQVYWTRRGRPGAFANPRFRQFHHALIDRSTAVELLQISAGDQVIGYLQNFCHRSRVAAYQSGFDYDAAETHAKPGLTCHQLAIEQYLADGMHEYDFLAGDDRYKTSLSTDSRVLHWVTLAPKWSVPGIMLRIRSALRPYQRPADQS